MRPAAAVGWPATVLTDVEPIAQGVSDALAAIRAVYPRRPITVVYGLRRALIGSLLKRRAPDCRLIAVLPFPRHQYEEDFGPHGSPSRLRLPALLARAHEVVVAPRAPRLNHDDFLPG
ncbi:MAG TPA: hypothetical protein VGL99_20595 [Chloroflexota bacterium]